MHVLLDRLARWPSAPKQHDSFGLANMEPEMDLNSDEFRIFHFKVRPDPDGQIALSKHQHGSLSHIARCPVITRLTHWWNLY